MKKYILFISALLLLVVLFYYLFTRTGFLQQGTIDVRDLERWQFQSGVISGAEPFVLDGDSERCWVMVHGYTSTPDELHIVAEAVHSAYNDTVYVPRLYGHGMVPSALLGYSVDDWYDQVEQLAQGHHCTYLLGSSMGASLALRYAEEHDVQGIVLVGTPLWLQPRYLPSGIMARAMLPVAGYLKRQEPGQTVDDPTGGKKHISGYSFPLNGVVELDLFNAGVIENLGGVRARVLFLHPTYDTVAFIGGARDAYDLLRSDKRFVELDADHIVFRDYNKEKAIDEVLRFRGQDVSVVLS